MMDDQRKSEIILKQLHNLKNQYGRLLNKYVSKCKKVSYLEAYIIQLTTPTQPPKEGESK